MLFNISGDLFEYLLDIIVCISSWKNLMLRLIFLVISVHTVYQLQRSKRW